MSDFLSPVRLADDDSPLANRPPCVVSPSTTVPRSAKVGKSRTLSLTPPQPSPTVNHPELYFLHILASNYYNTREPLQISGVQAFSAFRISRRLHRYTWLCNVAAKTRLRCLSCATHPGTALHGDFLVPLASHYCIRQAACYRRHSRWLEMEIAANSTAKQRLPRTNGQEGIDSKRKSRVAPLPSVSFLGSVRPGRACFSCLVQLLRLACIRTSLQDGRLPVACMLHLLLRHLFVA